MKDGYLQQLQDSWDQMVFSRSYYLLHVEKAAKMRLFCFKEIKCMLDPDNSPFTIKVSYCTVGYTSNQPNN